MAARGWKAARAHIDGKVIAIRTASRGRKRSEDDVTTRPRPAGDVTLPHVINRDTQLPVLLHLIRSLVSRFCSSPDIAMMQQGIPFGGGEIRRAVEENPVVVVGRSGCCMVHVVRRLLQGQGVNPVVCEVGEDADEAALVAGLQGSDDDIDLAAAALPAVFVGGRLVGGVERLVAVHITGELVPILKRAGALWL